MTPPVDLWCPLSERGSQGGRSKRREKRYRCPFIFVIITLGMCVHSSTRICWCTYVWHQLLSFVSRSLPSVFSCKIIIQNSFSFQYTLKFSLKCCSIIRIFLPSVDHVCVCVCVQAYNYYYYYYYTST